MSALSLKVLVVDDEVSIRSLLSLVLTRLGHESREAADGREALAVLETWPCDLLITDLRMPRMGGHALLRTLRAQGNRIPAIVITGYSPDMTREDAAALGISEVLAKPFSVPELAAALKRTVERAAAPAASG